MKKQEKINAWKKMKAGVKGDKFGRGVHQNNGLCHVLTTVYYDYDLDDEVAEYIRKILRKLKRMKDSAYVWEPGVKAPRIKWINEQIKKIEGKK